MKASIRRVKHKNLRVCNKFSHSAFGEGTIIYSSIEIELTHTREMPNYCHFIFRSVNSAIYTINAKLEWPNIKSLDVAK